jgi:hypothetical protein
MSCQIFRNENNQVIKVTAANGEDSLLYRDILNLEEVGGDNEIAVDMWLTAYTPAFKSYFGDWENGKENGMVDVNGEPSAITVKNYLESSAPELEQALTFLKPGVSELFKSNPELAAIGTPEQYSQYLDSIFPDSKVKDIVYHGSSSNFEQFSKNFLGSNLGQISPDSKLGFFFSNLENAKGFGKNIFTTLLNMPNPKIVTEEEYKKLSGGTREFQNKVFSGLLTEAKQENKDSVLADFRVSDYMGSKQYVVFEPEQIHILGNKQDVEGFKNFVAENTMVDRPMSADNTMYQLSSTQINAASAALDNHLLNFLKSFGVKSKEFEDLKARLGVDALGATDTLNKLIWYAKDRKLDTIPEEAAHMVVMLMGESNPLIKDLLIEIKNWSQYQDVYDQYMPIYKNEKQVQIEAVGKLIAESLVKNYQATGLDKTLLEKALAVIEAFFERIKEILSLADAMNYPYYLADKIAINVLSGNTGFVAKTVTDVPLLNYEKAVSGNPHAKNIIEEFTAGKFKLKLVGSLAIAGQNEKIYRPANDPIHDLDFIVKNTNEANDLFIYMNEQGYQPVHFGWSNSNKDYVTHSFYITAPGYQLIPGTRSNSGWMQSFTVVDDKGNKVYEQTVNENLAFNDPDRLKAYSYTTKNPSEILIATDFFIYENESKLNEKFSGIFSSWQDIYSGKLSLSTAGSNERMFQRSKDQQDYVLSRPGSLNVMRPEFVYYQLNKSTTDFVENLKGKANDLQKKIIDEVYHTDPDRKVVLDQEDHVYTHVATGKTLISVTTAIKGGLKDPEGLYEMNRLFGQSFDQVLQVLVEGGSFEEALPKMKGILNEEISKEAFQFLQGYLTGLTADGSVVLPQVILADITSGIAGSLDLLLVKPDGTKIIIDLKVSKNSIKNPAYASRAFDVNITDENPKANSLLTKTSATGSIVPERLTTKQQHGIQVGVYKKLAEINGLGIESVQTVHIHLQIEGQGKDQKVTSFATEGVQHHYVSENQSFIDRIVPTAPGKDKTRAFKKELGLNNPADDKDFLTEEEEKPEVEISGDLMSKLFGVVNSYKEKLEIRRTYLEEIRSSLSFQPKKETIDRISELLAAIDIDIKQGQANVAFGRLLNYSKEQLTKIDEYLKDLKAVNTPEYIDVVLEAEKFTESYRGLVRLPDLGLNNANQLKLIMQVQSLLDHVSEQINPALENYVKGILRTKSNKNFTEEELDTLLKEGFDISLADYALSDMANSKDALLAIANKIYAEAVDKAHRRTDDFINTIKAAGNNLSQAVGGKVDFSFMLTYNKAGEFIGRYVQKIGQQYWDKYYQIKNTLKGADGQPLEYIIIENLEDATDEQLAHNIELQRKKQVWRDFVQAEVTSKTGYEDGEFHKYTEEFKTLRSQFQTFVKGAWVKKNGISDVAYRAFLEKNFNKVNYTKTIREKDGSFKGRTEKTVGFFPKNQYVEIKEISTAGEDMRDPKYVKLKNPITAVERAQSAFYEVFDKEMKDTLEKLPLDAQRKLMGKVARVKDNFMDTAKREGSSKFKAIVKGIRSWFDLTPKVFSLQRVTDENGLLQDSIPMMYTGNIRNEGRVAFLEEQLAKLKNDYFNKKILKVEDYQQQKEEIEQKLNYEKSNISFSEINTDLVENIIAFRKMAENYEQVSTIESSLLSIAKVVENKKYFVTDALGRKFTVKGSDNQSATIQGSESNTHKRLKKWFKMVYYNNDEYDASTVAQVMEKAQNITSLKGMGLNIFGAVNNYVMGRINTAIDAWGGIYFDKDAAFRAAGEYNKDYIPGVFRGLGSKSGEYKLSTPQSKYEALVQKFRMVRKFQADSGRVDVMGWAYFMQEGGEFNVQSKSGMAVLMSKKDALTHQQSGETLSIYDAYNFDPNTGELSLKPGYELDESKIFEVTNYIFEVNKQIHGNYAWEDRMVIQSHWLGKLGAQFHKWVVPAIKARLQSRHENETLGVIEGRYRTFYNFVKHIYQTEQNWFTGTLKAAKGTLSMLVPGNQTLAAMSELERGNMRKNIAEMTFLLTSMLLAQVFGMLSAGIDDDDEELKKLVNFLQYQQSRQANEILTLVPVAGIMEQYQLVKSPIAVLGTAKEYAQVLSQTMQLPFPPYDDAIYERGPFKGDVKLFKEMKDVIPALGILNKWESFETVKSFYIK